MVVLDVADCSFSGDCGLVLWLVFASIVVLFCRFSGLWCALRRLLLYFGFVLAFVCCLWVWFCGLVLGLMVLNLLRAVFGFVICYVFSVLCYAA